MSFTFRDVVLSQEEFFELKQCVGEFRRICRDQVFRYVKGDYLKSECSVSNKRLNVAEKLVIFLDDIEKLNNNSK